MPNFDHTDFRIDYGKILFLNLLPSDLYDRAITSGIMPFRIQDQTIAISRVFTYLVVAEKS